MIKPELHLLNKNPSKFGSFAGYLGALALLLLSAISLWLDNQELSTDKTIFYWSLGVNLLVWTKCLTLPLAMACFFIWVKRNTAQLKRWQLFTSISILILLFVSCAFTHYVFAWAGSSIDNVGTVNFEGNTYHLARIVQFDEWDRYYLGACTSTEFWCKFHPIFEVGATFHPASVSIQKIEDTLVISVDSESVYTYDGLQELCTDRETAYCSVDNE